MDPRESAASPERRPPLDPAAVLAPGSSDAGRLWALWLVRRSFVWLLLVGITIGTLAAALRHDDAELVLDTATTGSVFDGVLTSFGLVFVAIIVRVVAGWVALAMAYPLAVAHQRDLALPARPSRRVATLLDRLRVARAVRELRWTIGVRGAALDRLGDAGPRCARLDAMVGIANVVSAVVCVVAIVAFGATIEA